MSRKTSHMMLTVCIAEEMEQYDERLDTDDFDIEAFFMSVFYKGVMAGALATLRVCDLEETPLEAMGIVHHAAEQIRPLIEEDDE